MDLTIDNLKAQSGLLLDKINANIGTNESEKLYYQTLALEKLQQIQRKTPAIPGDGILKLLSPTDAQPNDIRIFGNRFADNNNTYKYTNCFGSYGDGRWYLRVYTAWVALRLDKLATLHKYSLGTHAVSEEGRPNGWSILISPDGENCSTDGEDGEWFTIDTAQYPTVDAGVTIERDIAPEKLNHVTQWIKFNITSTYDPSSSNRNCSVSSLQYFGVEV